MCEHGSYNESSSAELNLTAATHQQPVRCKRLSLPLRGVMCPLPVAELVLLFSMIPQSYSSISLIKCTVRQKSTWTTRSFHSSHVAVDSILSLIWYELHQILPINVPPEAPLEGPLMGSYLLTESERFFFFPPSWPDDTELELEGGRKLQCAFACGVGLGGVGSGAYCTSSWLYWLQNRAQTRGTPARWEAVMKRH